MNNTLILNSNKIFSLPGLSSIYAVMQMSLQDGSLLAQMRTVTTRIERSKNMYRSLCPICRVNRLMTPHEVCDVCFNKIKRRWVHSRQFWENVSGESEAQRRGQRETSV
ncbi:hypothetical protein JGA83_24295, partial [Salmonella enterica subsp. enterica serovar Derby]|nr:hypothetical protein [Salmonella enterica subsp. enterica serovar Derby]